MRLAPDNDRGRPPARMLLAACPECGGTVEFWPQELMRRAFGKEHRKVEHALSVLELVAHHHEPDRMRTRNGAPLHDTVPIINMIRNRREGQEEELEREALTDEGKRIGRECLAHIHSRG